MIRVACYIRVSTQEQMLHGLSLDAQKEALKEYADKHNMQIVDFYADEGISARKRLDKRLEFQRLINDVKADKIDLILVTKLDRWFRNIKDYYNTQEILEAHDCNWRTIFESYDTTTSAGRLHINIMLSVNQDECDRCSERIKAVFKHKIENKEFVSGTTPLGYKIEDKRLVKNDNEIERVNFIFEHFEIYNNKTKLLRDYNEKFNENYSYGSITKTLTNTIYKGEYKGIKDFCEPYITDVQFSRNQEKLKKNVKNRVNNRVYAYSGLLRCSECGKYLSGSCHYKTVAGERKEYRYYGVSPAYARGCKSCGKKTREFYIDNYVLKNLQAELSKYRATFEVKAKQVDNTVKINALNTKIKRLKDLYVNELIELDEYKHDLSDYKAQIEALTVKPIDTNLDAVNRLIGLDLKHLWQELNDTEKQVLLRSVIKEIYISTTGVVGITFL